MTQERSHLARQQEFEGLFSEEFELKTNGHVVVLNNQIAFRLVRTKLAATSKNKRSGRKLQIAYNSEIRVVIPGHENLDVPPGTRKKTINLENRFFPIYLEKDEDPTYKLSYPHRVGPGFFKFTLESTTPIIIAKSASRQNLEGP